MSATSGNHYQFGDHRLDISEQTMHKGDERIALTPKAFETLVFFLENPGRLIQKNELMENLWPDRFVEEGNLTFHIGMLRKALEDDPKSPRYIETVARRGYRFVAEITSPVDNAPTDFSPSDAFAIPQSDTFSPLLGADRLTAPDLERQAEDLKWLTTSSDDSNDYHHGQAESTVSLSKLPVRRFNTWLIAFCLVAISSVSVAYAVYRFTIYSPNPALVATVKTARLTSNGNAKAAAVSPDGRFVAYVLEESDKNTLWLTNILADSTIQIPLPAQAETVSNFSFSPDGNFLYFGVAGVLYRLPVLGGTPLRILDSFNGGQYNNISFSPDGERFAFLRATGTDTEEANSIIISDADGSNQHILASSRRPNLFLRSVAWSPDGDKIACVALNKRAEQFPVIVNITDGTTIPYLPTRSWAYAAEIAWQPSGKGLFLLGEDKSDLTLQIFSLSYPDGEAKNIVNDTNSYLSLSPTADGMKIIAVRAAQEAHIWTAPLADPTTVKQLTHGFEKFDGVLGLNWTTDGRIIYESLPTGTPNILSIDSNGAESKRLVNEGGIMAASPDGRYLVYQRAAGDGPNENGLGLFRFDVATNAKIRLTTGVDLYPAFSHDGREVVFTRYGDEVALWKVSIEGGEAKKLTDFHGLPECPSFSPDGSLIAFHRSKSGKMNYGNLVIIHAQSGKILKDFSMPAGAMNPAQNRSTIQWRLDGKALYYAIYRNGVTNLWQQPIEGGEPTQVTNFESGQIFNFAVSPQGRIAYSRGTYGRDVIAFSLSQ